MGKLLSMLLIAALALGLPTAAGAAEEEALAVPVSSTLEPSAEIGLPEESEASEPPAEDDGFAEAAAEDIEEAVGPVAAPSGEIASGDAEAAEPLAVDGDAEAASETGEIIERDGLTYRIEGGAATVIASSEDLVDVVIPEQIDGVPVVCIGESAFMGHVQLQRVTIPASVERIQGPPWPRSIQLGPDGYVDGTGAFYGCTSLTSVDFSENSRLKTIGACAFYRTAIREVELPSSVFGIGMSAFARCSSLQSIRIPDDVQALSAVFMWCTALKDIHLPDELVILDMYTFDYCSALKEIALPDNVQIIGVGAFAECTALERVKYAGESLETIDSGAFSGCVKLVSCPLPGTLTTLGAAAFASTALSGTIEIPRGLTRIEDNTFAGCRRITKVILPETLESIGSYAFYNCGLTGIELPDGLSAVGDTAFCSCTSLKTISFPDSVHTLGNNVMNGCTALTKVHLPKDLKRIEHNSFVDCYALTEINIPDGVTSIGISAFQNCKALRSITLPDSVEEIGSQAFCRCSALRTVRLSPNVRVLEEGVFAECTALETITVPEGVEIIKGGVLYGCNKLKTVQLPASLRAIDEVLFPACDSVAGVDFAGTKAEWRSLTINHADPSLCDVTVRCADGDCTVVGEGCCGSQWYLFKDGSMDFVWNVDYGENRMEDHSLDSLPPWLDEWFLNMTDSGKITELRFHEGVPAIGAYAFASSDVKTVTLSKDIKSIGAYAFSGCADLTDVYYEGTSEQWAAIEIGAGNDALKRVKIHYGEAPGVRGLPGDADGNGCIDEHDLHEFLRFLAMETFFVRHAADLTDDGSIDREDLLPLVTLLRDQMTAEDAGMLLKEGFTYEAAWALRYAVEQTPA